LTQPVYIVLATYNGERFLSAQIESLIAQRETDWILLVRDDGSTDGTQKIMESFARRDSRIVPLANDVQHSGSVPINFGNLLGEAYKRGAEFILSCDQDDLWHPNKLTDMLHELERLDIPWNKPLLLHHDLAVMDDELEPISDSYWNFSRIEPGTERNPARMLSRNEVTGCAMLCNRALLEIALPVPQSAIMHDWWLALCAAHFGNLRFMARRLVRYRQHGANTIGARSFWSGLKPGSMQRSWKRGNTELRATVDQARSFLERFHDRLSPAQLRAVDAYASLFEANRIARLKRLVRSGAWRRNWFLDSTLVARLLILAAQEK